MVRIGYAKEIMEIVIGDVEKSKNIYLREYSQLATEAFIKQNSELDKFTSLISTIIARSLRALIYFSCENAPVGKGFNVLLKQIPAQFRPPNCQRLKKIDQYIAHLCLCSDKGGHYTVTKNELQKMLDNVCDLSQWLRENIK